MARKKTSPIEDLIELASLLPPWLGPILALVSYFVLHSLSQGTLSTSASSEPSSMVRLMLIKVGAGFGQYVLPFIFLSGSLFSLRKRIKRKKLADQTRSRGKLSALLEMSWHEFELLVSQALRERGYQVEETGGKGPDGGVDLILKKGQEITLVQCKQWRAQNVGVDVVRELYGVMAARGAAAGIVVSAGNFTADAKAFADGRNIQLMDGNALLDVLKVSASRIKPIAKKSEYPDCPKCGATMLRRVAAKGNNAGKPFWGCPTYPACRGTREFGN